MRWSNALLLTFALCAAGCDAKGRAPATNPEVPDDPKTATPPANTGEAKEVIAEVEEEAAQEGETIAFFKGVAELPSGHRCRDDAPVAALEMVEATDDYGAIETNLKRYRVEDPGYSHFGPRTVRGARWQEGDVERMVVTCIMGGAGFGPTTRDEFLKHELPLSKGFAPVWDMNRVGEVNSVAWADIQWLSRTADSAWKVDASNSRWSNDDEGNSRRSFFAESWVTSVQDADGDGVIEATGFTVGDCRRFHDEVCPKFEGQAMAYVVHVTTREGDQMATQRLVYDPTGKSLKDDEATGDEALRGLMNATLPEVRTKALAMLREAGKLADGS